MRRLAFGEWLFLSGGIVSLLLGTLAWPQIAYADSSEVTQCQIYCNQTYTGQKAADCRDQCTKYYGATCGSDCNDCGGINSPDNNNLLKCGGGAGAVAFSCQNWCTCYCTANLGPTWSCFCQPGTVGSGGSPPGY